MLPAKLQTLMHFNPLYIFINSTREIILFSKMPSYTSLFACAGFGIGFLLIGMFIFKKNQDKFIYYI